MKKFSIGRIVAHLDGELDGDSSLSVIGMAEIEQAQIDQLCFAESDKYLPALESSAAGAVIVPRDFPSIDGKTLIRVDNPRLGFIRAMELFSPNHSFSGAHESSEIADSVKIGENTGIGPNVVIEDGAQIGSNVLIRAGTYIGKGVTVGDDCVIGPNVSVLYGCRVGNNCLLHPGVCIGADGYGFRWLEDHHHKIPQLGTVVIEDNVEIGANSCIDRATMGETRIGSGTKIDNLVHIAHNCTIGNDVIMTALVGIAGSSKIGDQVVLAGQAGVIDHVEIGKGAMVAAKALVTKDVSTNSVVWGIPARPIKKMKKQLASIFKLPGIARELNSTRRELQILKTRLEKLERTRK